MAVTSADLLLQQMSESAQVRTAKGNAAVLHHLFMDKDGLKNLFGAINKKGSALTQDEMADLLADQHIVLKDDDLKKLCDATITTEKELFTQLFAIQQAEIKEYLRLKGIRNAAGAKVSTTQKYYEDFSNALSAGDIKGAADYANKNKDKKNSQWAAMDREYSIYMDENKPFGSKADNIKLNYVLKYNNDKKVNICSAFTAAKKDEVAFGGLHVKVNTAYKPKEGTPGAEVEPGKGHHISMHNLQVPGGLMKAMINRTDYAGKDSYAFTDGTKPFERITFTLDGKKYGVFYEAGAPGAHATIYKVPILDDGKFDVANKSKLKAEESTAAIMHPPYGDGADKKNNKQGSVSHAFAAEMREAQKLHFDVHPELAPPIITSDSTKPSSTPTVTSTGSSADKSAAMKISGGDSTVIDPALLASHDSSTTPPSLSMTHDPSVKGAGAKLIVRGGRNPQPANRDANPEQLTIGGSDDELVDDLTDRNDNNNNNNNINPFMNNPVSPPVSPSSTASNSSPATAAKNVSTAGSQGSAKEMQETLEKKKTLWFKPGNKPGSSNSI